MAEERRRLIEGFRWLCTPGKTPCELCAANCGRKFYYDPEPGQDDAKGVNFPPLHPNCKCDIQLLTNQAYIVLNMAALHWGENPNYNIPGLSPAYNTGTIGMFGLI